MRPRRHACEAIAPTAAVPHARARLAGRRNFPHRAPRPPALRAPPQSDWTVHRELWIEEGFKMRARFDANKDLKDPVQIQKVLAEGEAELWEFRHPDPYVLNHMPGGTKYQRYRGTASASRPRSAPSLRI